MSTIEAHLPAARPQPLLSATARLAAAAAVVAVLAGAWLSAGSASRHALETTSAALTRHVSRIALPMVEVVGRREARTTASLGAAAGRDCAGQPRSL